MKVADISSQSSLSHDFWLGENSGKKKTLQNTTWHNFFALCHIDDIMKIKWYGEVNIKSWDCKKTPTI